MADKPSLLIVDDDALITDTLAYALSGDFDVTVSDSRKAAVNLVRRAQTPPASGSSRAMLSRSSVKGVMG